MPFFFVNQRLVMAVIALLLLFSFVYAVYDFGYKSGQKDAMIKSAKVTEERNKIASKRPSDDAVFFSGLLDRTKDW